MDTKVQSMIGGAPPAAAGTPHCNSTAIDAISERLAEVTALAEQLDRALAAAQLEPSATAAAAATQIQPSANETSKSAGTANPEAKLESTEEDHSDTAVLSTSSANTSGDAGESLCALQEWRCSSSPPAGASAACGSSSCAGGSTEGSTLSDSSSRTLTAVQEIMPQRLALKATASTTSCRSHFDDRSSSDDFLTASECTCTPPSRSSSFHTASEGGVASPWWEHSEDGEDAHGIPATAAHTTPLDSASVARHQDLVETRVPLVASPIPVPAAYLSDSADTGDEVLTGILERRSVTETRQLQVRRGGAETRAVSQASVTETKLISFHPSPPPTPPPPLPLPLPLPLRADEAFFLDDLPLPSPPPPPFADDPLQDDDTNNPDPLSLLKEVSETGLPPPPSPPAPSTGTARFYCHPHLARHAIKGIF